MAKHYPQTLWDAIRAYWENSNASYAAAAEAVGKGGDTPNKSAISSRAKLEGWKRKNKISDGQSDANAKSDGQSDGITHKRIHKKADLLAIAKDGLAEVILKNEYLTTEQIDEVCEDYRAQVISRHRNDFNTVNEVVDKCVMIFRKIVDILHDGGQVQSGDVIERDGFVHQGMMDTLKMIDVSLKALLNASAIKNIIQTNERKAYNLETYEEPSSTGNLAQKALSSKGMGNHYERIRLSKKEERERMKDKLKSVTQ